MVPMDFKQAWAKAQRGQYVPGLFDADDLYGQHAFSSHSGKSRHSLMRSMRQSPQMKEGLRMAAVVHASNARATHNAIDRLEQWANRARYGCV